MKKRVDDCCSCAVPGYPCIGPCYHDAIFCDDCEEEIEDLENGAVYDGRDLCEDCLRNALIQDGIIQELVL